MVSIKVIRVLIISAFIVFLLPLEVCSQMQSYWSKDSIKYYKNYTDQLVQYSAPLFEYSNDFFTSDSIKKSNKYAAVHSWLVKDFNLDGYSDIFLAFFAGGENQRIPFKIFFYEPMNGRFVDKSFLIQNNIGQTFNRKAMSADLNGDLIPDFVAVSHPECDTCKLSSFDIILSDKSNGTWIQKTLKTPNRKNGEGYFHGCALGDIDNDGDIDIVLANENTFREGNITLINDGNANFIEKYSLLFFEKNITKYGTSWTTELSDINADGYLDLFYWHDSTYRGIAYGDGSGVFGNKIEQRFPKTKFQYIMDYESIDIDKDGDLDLILSTTEYNSWELVFLENMGKSPDGKVIFNDRSLEINGNLIKQGFYGDIYSNSWVPYISLLDLNKDGKYDIIPQTPISNLNVFNRWILLGDSKWSFKYKKLPYAEPPKSIVASFADSGKIKLSWTRAKQSFSTSDGGIEKWAIYTSDKNWGDRSQVSKPLILSAKETFNNNSDVVIIEPIHKEVYIRIAAIDSTGIETPLSNVIKVSIPPPIIYSVVICSDKELTIRGKNFIGVKNLTIDGTKVKSFSVISDSLITGEINSGQKGNLVLTTVNGDFVFTDVTQVVPPSEPFIINGSISLSNGSIQTYSVPNSTGVKYNWVFPSGWEQLTGSNTNSVTVKVNVSSGLIQVVPSAVCGNLKTITLSVKVYSYIPDDNFQKALQEIGIDKESKNDSILTSSLLNITSLALNSKNISDMTCIQDFTSLKQLECRNNLIKELNLKSNTQLTGLFCTNNKIDKLDISGNPLLTALFCDQNQLTSLDLSQNKLLFTIGCGLNQLKSIDFSKNKELAYVSFSNNLLSNVDLTNNIKLVLLHCWENKLTELDLRQNINLAEINCSSNQLLSLDFSKNSSLTTIIASSNKLKSFNIKNNKNGIIKTFSVVNNSSLTCIQVDDVKAAFINVDWKKDPLASYAENCPPIIISISATTVCKGDSITILGSNFTTISSISIGGVSVKSFTVVSPTKIVANVGDGATGSISISNIYGNATFSSVQTEKVPDVPSTIAGPNSVCQGQNAVIYSISNISNATSYVWTLPAGYDGNKSLNTITINFGSNALTGVISVKGRNVCGDGPTATIPISVNPIPTTPKITLTDKLLRSDASQGNQWYNRNVLISGANNQDYTLTADGEYAVKVTVNGCTSDFSNVIQFIITAIDNVLFQKDVLTSPNPVSNYLEIRYSGILGKVKYELYTVNGKLIKTGVFLGKTKIDTEQLRDGIYLLKLSNGKIFSYRKIIKRVLQ